MIQTGRNRNLIAEANGLSGNANLKAGQVLTVPARIGSSNKAGAFMPYDPSVVIGHDAQHAGAQARGLGDAGMILAVVIVVVTVYTVGLASSANGAFVLTMQAGATAMASAGTAASTLTVRHTNPNV